VDSTTVLLRRIRQGDTRAREELARSYLPVVKRLAHGRIPPSARGLVDTNDIVSVALRKAIDHIEGFEPRREGAFLAYLRRIVFNEIRTEIRRAKVRPGGGELDSDHASHDPSPLDRLIGSELMNRYEAALEHLTPLQRSATILRIEYGLGYREIADEMDLDSPDAARMQVARALARLAKLLRVDRADGDDGGDDASDLEAPRVPA
jgi:RNA polymerase sigma factor (sigma-70 family)